jgi:hypothetical protein
VNPIFAAALEVQAFCVIQPGVALVTCSAEDLIVFKAFAGRERDWLDIEGIALRQRGRLDEPLIWAETARGGDARFGA